MLSIAIFLRRVRSSLLGLGWLLALSTATQAEPKLTVSEERWDFGIITASFPVQHVFKLRNTGDMPLKIGQITPGCGCLVTSLKSDVIGPGQEASLGVTFNAANVMPGETAEKTVTLTCNDPQEPVRTLAIHGTLSYQGLPEVAIQPMWICLKKKGNAGTAWTKMVLINHRKEPCDIQILETSGAIRKATLPSRKIPALGRAEINLLVDRKRLAEEAKEGHSATVLLQGKESSNRVTIPACMEAVKVSPLRIRK